MEAKMENYLWQKTLLDLYHQFGRAVMIADNKFDRIVTQSLFNHNTNMLVDDLFCVMARKNNCLTAKVLVDQAFKYLISNNKNILCDYHKNKMSFKNIAQKENINIRQVFRNYDKELAAFAGFLTQCGYSTEVIQLEFGSDSLFSNAFEKIAQKANNRTQVCLQLPYTYCDDNKKGEYGGNFTKENHVCYFGHIACD